MKPERRMKISSWQVRGAIGALSLIVVGGMLGMITHHLIGRDRAVEIVSIGADDSALVAFRGVLELDDDQMAAIHRILLRHQTRVDETWQSLRVEIQAEVESAHSEIRVLLSPHQLTLFEAWLERHVRHDPGGDPALLWNH